MASVLSSVSLAIKSVVGNKPLFHDTENVYFPQVCPFISLPKR